MGVHRALLGPELEVVGSLVERQGVEYRGLVITKVVDLVGDHFVLDKTQQHKNPDWSYDA